ncbi:MAG: hypothetical protein GY759_23035 [Chloroflexi bacterium]|nr:hypothetical protein [Chloroflexota bacterium]
MKVTIIGAGSAVFSTELMTDILSTPTHFGSLPTHLANLDQQHMAFHDLAATAILMKVKKITQ